MRPESPQVRSVAIGDGAVVHVAAQELAGRRWHVTPSAAGVGIVLGLLALAWLGLSPRGLLAGGVIAVLTVLSAIDLRWRLLPNRIVLPATAAVLVWQIVFFPDRSVEWLLAAPGAAAALLLPSLLRPGSMGMGDVKLAALLGAALGTAVLPALILACLATVPFTVALVVRRGSAARKATLPFGPFLAFGAAVVLIAPA